MSRRVTNRIIIFQKLPLKTKPTGGGIKSPPSDYESSASSEDESDEDESSEGGHDHDSKKPRRDDNDGSLRSFAFAAH